MPMSTPSARTSWWQWRNWSWPTPRLRHFWNLPLRWRMCTAILKSWRPAIWMWSGTALRTVPTMCAELKRNCEQHRSILILLPMRPSMGKWHSTTSHIRRTAPAKKPLSRPSAPPMQSIGWIRRRRSKMCWKSSGRNGYSLFLPTPSSARTMTGVSLRTIKHGQKTFLRWRTAALPATVPIWL